MAYLWLNGIAILVAGLVGLAPLAAVWGASPRRLALALGASVWIAAILAGALIIAPVPENAWVVALITASILWGGFILPALVATLRARAVAWPAIAVDATAWLAALLLQAVALRLVGLTPLS